MSSSHLMSKKSRPAQSVTVTILTLFPKIFDSVFAESIVKRGINQKLLHLKVVNIRDFAADKHKTVDDKPYGGGIGMVMRPDVIVAALERIRPKPYSILLSPTGNRYDQKKAMVLSKKSSLALICGHYEGVDARVENFVDEIISIGDYILTGGEIAAMAIVDSLTRLIPGVIKPQSLLDESFSKISNFKFQISNLLEYPQYTRPENFRGDKVPKVLLSGNHREIEKWRHKKAIALTKKLRPDLLATTKS